MTVDHGTKREAALARWRRVREKGPLRFILVRGVLGWGVTTAILWCVLMSLFTGKDFPQLLMVSLVGFPLGGVLWGTVMWFVAERQYARAIR